LPWTVWFSTVTFITPVEPGVTEVATRATVARPVAGSVVGMVEGAVMSPPKYNGTATPGEPPFPTYTCTVAIIVGEVVVADNTV